MKCIICGNQLTAKQQKYCKPLCSAKALTAARKADGRAKVYREKNSVSRKAWSKANRARYKGKYNKISECEYCTAQFMQKDYRAKCCGDFLCRYFALAGRWPQSNIPYLACIDCGTLKVNRNGGSNRCDNCRAINRSKPTFKIQITKRHRIELYERDSWICQLCFEPVNPDEDPCGNWGASLDHIIPRSKGGDETVGNLRLAHRWCNSVRGDETYYTAADLVA